jgi:hypothetical protein
MYFSLPEIQDGYVEIKVFPSRKAAEGYTCSYLLRAVVDHERDYVPTIRCGITGVLISQADSRADYTTALKACKILLKNHIVLCLKDL